jgi:hypothetical protein
MKAFGLRLFAEAHLFSQSAIEAIDRLSPSALRAPAEMKRPPRPQHNQRSHRRREQPNEPGITRYVHEPRQGISGVGAGDTDEGAGDVAVRRVRPFLVEPADDGANHDDQDQRDDWIPEPFFKIVHSLLRFVADRDDRFFAGRHSLGGQGAMLVESRCQRQRCRSTPPAN